MSGVTLQWSLMSERIDTLVDRIELIKLAVEGLRHGSDVPPRDNRDAVDTVIAALYELQGDLEHDLIPILGTQENAA